MRVAIAGGSGLLGGYLATALVARGDDVLVLSRDPDRARPRVPAGARIARWSPEDPADLAEAMDGVEAVVSLVGIPVGPWPWTARRRRAIAASRIEPTRAIVDAIRMLPEASRPAVLVSASGTDGYEGRDEVPATEKDATGDGFLARVCEAWEAEAGRAKSFGVRVVVIRIGFVLARRAAVLRLFTLPFRLGLGGPLGSGHQWMSWVHVDDVVGLVILALDDSRAEGPLNAVAPEPAHEAAVAAAIGDALGRPPWLRIPAWLIRLAMGEASILALGSRRIIPARAIELGYAFRWTDLRAAIRDVM